MSIKINSVFNKRFKEYGRVIDGEKFQNLIDVLLRTPAPSDAVVYIASDEELEAVQEVSFLERNCYGGMPIQIGYCNGTNTKLNCLEYHKDNEINIAGEDAVLLLARLQDIEYGMLATSKVEAFLLPKGVAVELYQTSLHYAPCSARNGEHFRVAIVLPKGTNVGMPKITLQSEEDKFLFARNKWLFAHPASEEAERGAQIGLMGENIDISDSID